MGAIGAACARCEVTLAQVTHARPKRPAYDFLKACEASDKNKQGVTSTKTDEREYVGEKSKYKRSESLKRKEIKILTSIITTNGRPNRN